MQLQNFRKAVSELLRHRHVDVVVLLVVHLIPVAAHRLKLLANRHDPDLVLFHGSEIGTGQDARRNVVTVAKNVRRGEGSKFSNAQGFFLTSSNCFKLFFSLLSLYFVMVPKTEYLNFPVANQNNVSFIQPIWTINSYSVNGALWEGGFVADLKSKLRFISAYKFCFDYFSSRSPFRNSYTSSRYHRDVAPTSYSLYQHPPPSPCAIGLPGASTTHHRIPSLLGSYSSQYTPLQTNQMPCYSSFTNFPVASYRTSKGYAEDRSRRRSPRYTEYDRRLVVLSKFLSWKVLVLSSNIKFLCDKLFLKGSHRFLFLFAMEIRIIYPLPEPVFITGGEVKAEKKKTIGKNVLRKENEQGMRKKKPVKKIVNRGR